MRLLLLLVFSLSYLTMTAQQYSSSNPNYIKFAKAGERTLASEQYDSCVIYLKQAFEIKQTSFLSTLRAAACGFSSNNTEYYNAQLNKAMEINWGGTKSLFYSYPEFSYLHGTDFEKDLEAAWAASAKAAGVNIELMEELAEIRITDQAQRNEMGDVEEKYGWESPQMDSLWKLQNYSDSVNALRVMEIIEEYGYPGKSLVGAGQAGTAFLVIQHGNLEIQEKYLETIKKAADADELPWSSVALLVDRVTMRKGNPQIYGSQILTDKESGRYYFAEIENPEQVDSIRASVGLGPIQEYGNNWDIIWDPVAHKKKIKAIKEREQQKSLRKNPDRH